LEKYHSLEELSLRCFGKILPQFRHHGLRRLILEDTPLQDEDHGKVISQLGRRDIFPNAVDWQLRDKEVVMMVEKKYTPVPDLSFLTTLTITNNPFHKLDESYHKTWTGVIQYCTFWTGFHNLTDLTLAVTEMDDWDSHNFLAPPPLEPLSQYLLDIVYSLGTELAAGYPGDRVLPSLRRLEIRGLSVESKLLVPLANFLRVRGSDSRVSQGTGEGDLRLPTCQLKFSGCFMTPPRDEPASDFEVFFEEFPEQVQIRDTTFSSYSAFEEYFAGFDKKIFFEGVDFSRRSFIV
jgi:hypothetical protein